MTAPSPPRRRAAYRLGPHAEPLAAKVLQATGLLRCDVDGRTLTLAAALDAGMGRAP